MAITQPKQAQNVRVHAFARLHMGFLDLNGSQGRRYGGLGLGLEAPDTLIEITIGQHAFGEYVAPEYVRHYQRLILDHLNINQAVSIKVHREIPRHSGLGSGTQMALAVWAGISKLFNLQMSAAEIASITCRGQRSGIGIGTFANGGLVIDGGRSQGTSHPPIIMQLPFPSAWRILLIFDHSHTGLHGDDESKAFASLQDADLEQTRYINHQVLMRALPAIKEQNIEAFGEAVAAMQAYTGDYFAPIQGGRFASQSIGEVLAFLTQQGILGAGQSSWGPTGFAIFESEAKAQHYLRQLQSAFERAELGWLICRARNIGAVIEG